MIPTEPETPPEWKWEIIRDFNEGARDRQDEVRDAIRKWLAFEAKRFEECKKVLPPPMARQSPERIELVRATRELRNAARPSEADEKRLERARKRYQDADEKRREVQQEHLSDTEAWGKETPIPEHMAPLRSITRLAAVSDAIADEVSPDARAEARLIAWRPQGLSVLEGISWVMFDESDHKTIEASWDRVREHWGPVQVEAPDEKANDVLQAIQQAHEKQGAKIQEAVKKTVREEIQQRLPERSEQEWENKRESQMKATISLLRNSRKDPVACRAGELFLDGHKGDDAAKRMTDKYGDHKPMTRAGWIKALRRFCKHAKCDPEILGVTYRRAAHAQEKTYKEVQDELSDEIDSRLSQ